MKSFSFAAFTVFFFHLAHATDAPWKWQSARVPDLGFNLDNAQVIKVTSLDSKGPGTLREALLTKGPRVIVFEVAGVIDLDLKGIRIEEPQVVVAGQTAPSPGITLIRGTLQIKSDQTLIQHLHVRPGDAGQAKGSWEPDGMTTSGGPHDVWFDHCSCTWAIDENLSATTFKSPNGEPTRRVYLRNCLIAEGLNNSTHHKGPHSKGTLIDAGTQEVAVVGCLYASNVERNPVIHPGTSAVVVNSVIANPGQRAIHSSGVTNDSRVPPAKMSIVGNVVLLGKESKPSAAVFEGSGDAYFKDNEGYAWDGAPIPVLRQPFPTAEKPPLWPEGLEAISTTATLWNVARHVGARPRKRDAIDQRIVAEAFTGRAKLVDSQNDVGGYPKITPVTRKLEVPPTGRLQWLEKMAEEVD